MRKYKRTNRYDLSAAGGGEPIASALCMWYMEKVERVTLLLFLSAIQVMLAQVSLQLSWQLEDVQSWQCHCTMNGPVVSCAGRADSSSALSTAHLAVAEQVSHAGLCCRWPCTRKAVWGTHSFQRWLLPLQMPWKVPDLLQGPPTPAFPSLDFSRTK